MGEDSGVLDSMNELPDGFIGTLGGGPGGPAGRPAGRQRLVTITQRNRPVIRNRAVLLGAWRESWCAMRILAVGWPRAGAAGDRHWGPALATDRRGREPARRSRVARRERASGARGGWSARRAGAPAVPLSREVALGRGLVKTKGEQHHPPGDVFPWSERPACERRR